MHEREKKLKNTIRSIIEDDLKNLWENHRKSAREENGNINMSLVQKTRKIINDKLKQFEK